LKYYNIERTQLAGLYQHLCYILRVNPDTNEPVIGHLRKKKLDEIRQIIESYCIDPVDTLSESAKARLAPHQSITEILAYLQKFHLEEEVFGSRRRDEWRRISSEFEAATEKALIKMIDDELPGDRPFKGNEFLVEHLDSFSLSIVFESAAFSDGYNPDCAATGFELSKDACGYCLEFIQDDWETAPQPIALRFKTAKTKIICYDYSNQSPDLLCEPWRLVARSLWALKTKKDLLGLQYCNAAEIQLLPLCGFAPVMSLYSASDDSETEGHGARAFAAYAKASGNIKMAELTDEYASSADTKLSKKRLARMQKALIGKESERLCRHILAKIKAAASAYPKASEYNIDKGLLHWARSRIASAMHAQGFQGDYPHFRKLSSLRGLHVININNTPHLLVNEKHMASCIDCLEEAFGDLFQVTLSIGTVFLKSNQLESFGTMDSLSAFFANKERRKTGILLLAADESDTVDAKEFDEALHTAIKAAQCMKLTKEERRYLFVRNRFTPVASFIVWMISGLLFSLLWCIIFALVASLTLGFSLSDAGELPWLLIFFLGSLGFGVPLFVLDLMARRRG
jgi:hypothetical protein